MGDWLSPEQRALVERKRKGTRPTYYNSLTRSRVAISEDTEAALILLSAATKNTAAQYFQQFLDNQSKSKEYQDLLDEFAEKQIENASWASLEMETIFSGFDLFKTQLTGSGEKVFATGLQPMLKALALGLGALKRRKESLIYGRIHMSGASVNIPSSELSLDEKKEIASWIPVLSLY